MGWSHCPSCGSRLGADHYFCAECGYPVERAEVAADEAVPDADDAGGHDEGEEHDGVTEHEAEEAEEEPGETAEHEHEEHQEPEPEPAEEAEAEEDAEPEAQPEEEHEPEMLEPAEEVAGEPEAPEVAAGPRRPSAPWRRR